VDKILYCTRCGSSSDFYVGKSNLYKFYGKIPFCKKCIEEIYNELVKLHSDYKKAIYLLCRKLDIPFKNSVYDGAVKESSIKGWSIQQAYLKQINSFSEKNNYGTDFDDSEDFDSINQNKVFKINNINNDIETTTDLILKWGNLLSQDIQFLENEYIDWCRRYDVSSKAMEVNIKYICHQQLTINKKQESGQPVDKELKTLGDLMGNSALKPIQESAAMSAEFNTLGTWIKKFENEEPFPEPDEELKDVDGFKKYIRVWFLGHMCKILGLDNEYSQEYDEELLTHTINFDESEDDFEYNENDESEEEEDGDD
jgi:hypothetical protein